MSSAYQSFANLNYDKCALDKKDLENVNHFNLVVDSNVPESNNPCFMTLSPYSHNPFFSIPPSNMDVESDLRGQTRPLSRCPEVRYNPYKECENYKQGVPCGCELCKKQFTMNECLDRFLEPSYTREKKPCNIFSGITINRFDPICDDFQDLQKIQDNSYIGSNTRLAVRDTFDFLNKRVKL